MSTLTVNPALAAGEFSTIHRFELAGLGKAPFKFTGMSEKTYQACPGAPVQAGSTCDYCGTCIRYEFWCQSADGKTFKTGCDCIHKIGDAGLIRQISAAERQLKDQKNAAARKRKQERAAERVATAKAMAGTPEIAAKLASLPHPNSYFAGQGKTLADYVQWCFANAAERGAITVERIAKGE